MKKTKKSNNLTKKPLFNFQATETDTKKLKPDFMALEIYCECNGVELQCKDCKFEKECYNYKKAIRENTPLPYFVLGKYERTR